jgi:hypothetical protein
MAGQDWIEVQGGLSVGRQGWSLSAAASRHGETISIIVTARGGVANEPGIEEYAYTVRVRSIEPGSYRLTVSHSTWAGATNHYHVSDPLLTAEAWLPAPENSRILPLKPERPAGNSRVGRLRLRTGGSDR